MKNSTSLNCPQCSDLLLEPRILPCGKSICYYCVETNEDTIQFKCVFCKSTHIIPSGGFPINNELIQQIDNKSQEISVDMIAANLKKSESNEDDNLGSSGLRGSIKTRPSTSHTLRTNQRMNSAS